MLVYLMQVFVIVVGYIVYVEGNVVKVIVVLVCKMFVEQFQCFEMMCEQECCLKMVCLEDMDWLYRMQ